MLGLALVLCSAITGLKASSLTDCVIRENITEFPDSASVCCENENQYLLRLGRMSLQPYIMYRREGFDKVYSELCDILSKQKVRVKRKKKR